MKAVKEINIYLLKKRNAQSIDVVQYDTGIQLVFKVLDFDIPAGTTATLYVQKPSGKPVYQENGITVADNTIVIDLENQAITEHGKTPYQITLTNGNDEISTFSGILNVEKRVVNNESAVENSTVATVKLNELAVGIKGHLSGAVVSADDVSPIEHRPKVKAICPDGVDPATVKVKRCGKNLLTGFAPKTANGVTFTVGKDGTVTANGTATAETTINGRIYLEAGTYTVSGSLPNSTNSNGDIYVWASAMSAVVARSFTGSTANTFTLAEGSYVDAYCRIAKGRVCNNDTFYPQIEIGSVATDFEAYNGTEYAPTSNGTVDGVTSLSPCMTLLTDTDGVTIECEYIKDTNKVIAKIADALNITI